jgi:hypothetical protein
MRERRLPVSIKERYASLSVVLQAV